MFRPGMAGQPENYSVSTCVEVFTKFIKFHPRVVLAGNIVDGLS